jgi:hypothetical protein
VLKQFTAVKYVRNFLREFCTVSTVFKFFRVMQPVYREPAPRSLWFTAHRRCAVTMTFFTRRFLLVVAL